MDLWRTGKARIAQKLMFSGWQLKQKTPERCEQHEIHNLSMTETESISEERSAAELATQPRRRAPRPHKPEVEMR